MASSNFPTGDQVEVNKSTSTRVKQLLRDKLCKRQRECRASATNLANPTEWCWTWHDGQLDFLDKNQEEPRLKPQSERKGDESCALSPQATSVCLATRSTAEQWRQSFLVGQSHIMLIIEARTPSKWDIPAEVTCKGAQQSACRKGLRQYRETQNKK